MAPPVAPDLFFYALIGKYLIELLACPRDVIAKSLQDVDSKDRKLLSGRIDDA
jgi:hypothetical protein